MIYPLNIYDVGGEYKRYKYSINGISSGLGVLLKNFWNAEFEYFYRNQSFSLEEVYNNQQETAAGILLSAKLDLLDDVLHPWNGILLNGKYENSSTEWGATQNYHYYQWLGDIYFTRKRNTYRLMGYYHQGLNEFPRYIATLSSGGQSFVGIKEFQLWGNTLVFSRLEYRYKHKKDIFAHLIFNWLISAKADNNVSAENKWGTGIGITLLSPLGPMEFIWSLGPTNIYSDGPLQSLFHFSAGYKF